MLVSEIIRKKRDGDVLAADEIALFIEGLTSGAVSDAQVAAFAMAVIFQSMSAPEAAQLTLSMRDSGDVFQWRDLPGPVVDKHSTGGVGDNVSLMLAPIVAACGGYVPMISGRGLGHTGGTLDKMEAIPGYSVMPSNALFDKTVREVGCAIIGQTGNLAPADKRLYAIRDVTATVESVPLITASILSKKLAAGLGSLVMDVKCGNGAFMADLDQAQELAQSITTVAKQAGLPCHALITDMNAPLADSAGNAVEVVTAVEFLTGARREKRLEKVTVALCAEMLLTSGVSSDRDDAKVKVRHVLDSGAAAEVFNKMVAALGGPMDFAESYKTHLPKALVTLPVPANTRGHLTGINTREIGLAVVELGGGRKRASDAVDPAVGLTDIVPIGTDLTPDTPLAMVHARDEASALEAIAQVQSACEIAGHAPESKAVVIETIAQ